MILIADTSVLINFLNVDRMQLIGKHQPACVITDHVTAEVTELYPEQRERLKVALDEGHLESISVTDDIEIELFGRIQQAGRLGLGESSAIAVALTRGYTLAIDDRRAIRDATAFAAEQGGTITVYGVRRILWFDSSSPGSYRSSRLMCSSYLGEHNIASTLLFAHLVS